VLYSGPYSPPEDDRTPAVNLTRIPWSDGNQQERQCHHRRRVLATDMILQVVSY